jgi:hypothetical protein
MKTPREKLKYIHAYSKDLRDLLINAIEKWEKQRLEDISNTNSEDRKQAIIKVIECAYNSLVWKTLDKEERYNTKFFQNRLNYYLEEYPNLVVVNQLHTQFLVPVFDKRAIEDAFSNDIKPIHFE